MSTKGKTSTGGPINIVSEDPEVMALQAIIKGLQHFNKQQLSMRHLKVLVATEMYIRIVHGRSFPKASEIGSLIQIAPEDFEEELRELCEKRYLHEITPTFGECIMRYKTGSMGGTILRKMLNRPAKRKR